MPTESRDADAALVERARAGEFAAFEALVSRYEGDVYRLAMRVVRDSHDAEEVVQESFLAALEHLADFRGEAPFRNWLLRIATNASLKLLRQKRSHPAVGLDAAESAAPHPDFIAPWQEDVAELVQRREVRALLEQALNEIDEKHRLVFVLRDMEELSTEETAEALQISAANVKVRLMRARLMLRERLTRTLGDAGRAAAPHQH